MAENRSLEVLAGGAITIGATLLATGLVTEPVSHPVVAAGTAVLTFSVVGLIVALTGVPLARGIRARASSRQATKVRLPSSAAAEVRIERADYGIGDTWVDVTDQVTKSIRDGRLALTASRYALDIQNPKSGMEKRLDIRWTLDGIRQPTMFFPDGTPAMLPVPPDEAQWTELNWHHNGGFVVDADGRRHRVISIEQLY